MENQPGKQRSNPESINLKLKGEEGVITAGSELQLVPSKTNR